MRRGLSLSEFGNIPITQLYEMWIFDTFLEPQGPMAEDYRSAMNQFTMYMTSSNMTKKAAKSIKLSDFMSIKGKVFKSPEELEAEKKEKESKRAQAIIAQFTDPTVLALISAKQKGEVNG